MRDLRSALYITCLAGALALTACAGDAETAPENGAVQSEFDRLIEAAKYEIREGDSAKAGHLFDKALAINRRDPRLWVEIARFRFRGGEHFGALEAADYALSLDPQYAPALLLKAQFVRDAYGKAAAISWFEAAQAQHPDDPDLLAEYAATLGDLGRNRDMLKVVRELAEIDPREPRVHYLQAVLAARARDPVLASSLLKRSGMADKGVPSAMVVSAIIDMQQGNFDSAVTSLDALLLKQPYNNRVAELLARAMWLGGRDRELVERFGDFALGAESSPYLTMLVGRSFERQGRRDLAAAYLQRAMAAEPGLLTGLKTPAAISNGAANLGEQIRAAIKAGNIAEARTVARQYRTEYPQSADIRILSGDTELAAGDAKAALEEYAEAVKVRRTWPLVRKIISAYRMAGDYDAADALLVRQLRADPLNSEAMIMLAERSAEEEEWLRTAVLTDGAIKIGAGNDPRLVQLRLNALEALGDEIGAEKYRPAFMVLRPKAFLAREQE